MWRLPSFAIWDCSRQQRSCSQSVRCSHFRRGARRRAAPKVTPRPSRPSTFGMAPRSTRSTPTVTRVSSITQCPQSHVRDSVHPHTRSHQPGVATRPWYRGNGDVQHRNAGPQQPLVALPRTHERLHPLHHCTTGGKKERKKTAPLHTHPHVSELWGLDISFMSAAAECRSSDEISRAYRYPHRHAAYTHTPRVPVASFVIAIAIPPPSRDCPAPGCAPARSGLQRSASAPMKWNRSHTSSRPRSVQGT